MDGLPQGPFTIVYLEEETTETVVVVNTFETVEGVTGFIEGRKLNYDEYAIIKGKPIKSFKDQLSIESPFSRKE
jgi:hypothetical protein